MQPTDEMQSGETMPVIWTDLLAMIDVSHFAATSGHGLGVEIAAIREPAICDQEGLGSVLVSILMRRRRVIAW